MSLPTRMFLSFVFSAVSTTWMAAMSAVAISYLLKAFT
jgi:hypothetical protein